MAIRSILVGRRIYTGEGGAAIARKQKTEVTAAPREARGVAIGLTVAEVALALLLAWLVARSGVPRHASLSAHLGAADTFVLVAVLACLGLMAFVLAFWQWRLRGRDRVRLLLTGYVSLALSFCGLCWYDVSQRSRELEGAPSPLTLVREQTAAAALTLGALVAGMALVVVFLWLARRALNRAALDGIVRKDSHDPRPGQVRGTGK